MPKLPVEGVTVRIRGHLFENKLPKRKIAAEQPANLIDFSLRRLSSQDVKEHFPILLWLGQVFVPGAAAVAAAWLHQAAVFLRVLKEFS